MRPARLEVRLWSVQQAPALDCPPHLLAALRPNTGTIHPEGLVVGDIAAELGIPSSTLSHHLEKLKNEGLVNVRRENTSAPLGKHRRAARAARLSLRGMHHPQSGDRTAPHRCPRISGQACECGPYRHRHRNRNHARVRQWRRAELSCRRRFSGRHAGRRRRRQIRERVHTGDEAVGLLRARRLLTLRDTPRDSGAPDRSRTCDLWLRKPTLYPTELRARMRPFYAAPTCNATTRLRSFSSHGIIKS